MWIKIVVNSSSFQYRIKVYNWVNDTEKHIDKLMWNSDEKPFRMVFLRQGIEGSVGEWLVDFEVESLLVAGLFS